MTTTNFPAIIEKEGLPMIKTPQELITKVHEVFPPEHYNVMVPKVLNISSRVKIAIQVVELDSNPNLYQNKDFWGFPKKKGDESPDDEVIFHARAIKKLAAAANVQYIPSETGIIESEYDKSGRPLIIRAKATCWAINSLGNVRQGSGDYTYNYNNDLVDPRFEASEWQNGKKYRAGKPDMDQINRRRNNADRSAITGAKLRAFFDCLGIDNTISRKDIGKPFIVPCVIDDINYDDPDVKRMLIKRAVGAETEVYGDNRKPVHAEAEVIDSKVDTSTGEVISESESPEPEPEQKSEPVTEPELPEESSSDKIPRDVFISDWKDTSPQERATEIKRLAAKLEVDITKNNKGMSVPPPEKWNEKTQLEWLLYLAQKAGKIE